VPIIKNRLWLLLIRVTLAPMHLIYKSPFPETSSSEPVGEVGGEQEKVVPELSPLVSPGSASVARPLTTPLSGCVLVVDALELTLSLPARMRGLGEGDTGDREYSGVTYAESAAEPLLER
jgi:hypothetical protein